MGPGSKPKIVEVVLEDRGIRTIISTPADQSTVVVYGLPIEVHRMAMNMWYSRAINLQSNTH